MPPQQPCCFHKDSESHSKHMQRESTSFISQASLPSIPSLTIHSYPSTQQRCVATIRGHTSSYPSSIILLGKFLFIGSSDREIRLYKRSTLASEFDYENLTDDMVAAGTGAVKSLVVLADKIFSAHQDHKIRVWKLNSQEPDHQKLLRLATLPTLSDRAFKLLTPNSHVQIRRHKKCTWVHHVDSVSALALSIDKTLLYSVSWDRTIKIWQTTDFKCLESVRNAHDDAINAVALSDDGHVYTGSADRTIKVWRKSSGKTKHTLVSTLEKHNSGINALALSTDGSVLYSGSCDRSILVWEKNDSGDMVVVGALRGHAASILCLAVVSDLICSGSADNTARIWRGADGCYSCLAVLEGHKRPVKCLTAVIDHYNPSDETCSYLLCSGSLDCDIKVWKIFVPIL